MNRSNEELCESDQQIQSCTGDAGAVMIGCGSGVLCMIRVGEDYLDSLSQT